MTLEKRTTLRLKVQAWAGLEAENDIKFSGEKSWEGVTPEARKHLEKALRFYAEIAAARTFDALDLHGHLTGFLPTFKP